jgi:hypothetical protein
VLNDTELKKQIVERIKLLEHPNDAECVADAVLAMIIRERNRAVVAELDKLIGDINNG